MKSLFRLLLARLGYSLRHIDSDPVLLKLDTTREHLRLNRARPEESLYQLAQLALASHLRELLVLHRPDLVIDVGANRGQFAIELRRLGYSGEIVSFEPQKKLADALRTTAESDSRWTVIHGAAGQSAGQLVLETFADDTFSSFHAPSAAATTRFGALLKPGDSEAVAVDTLDSWLAGPRMQASRIFLKTDTQGHDLEVLKGAPNVLEKARIVMAESAVIPLYQNAPTFADLNHVLASAGFRLAGQYAVSHDIRDLAVMECDCLFTRLP